MKLPFTVVAASILAATPLSLLAQDATDASDGSTANEVVVSVEGGDLIHGKLVSESDDSIVLVSPVLGTVTLPRDRVVSIAGGADVEEAKAQQAAEQAKQAEAAEAAAKSAAEASPWKGTATVGFTYSNATTITSSLNLGLNVSRMTELNQLIFEAKYFYSYDDGAVTDNDVFANVDETYFFSKDGPWSLFASGTYQWDQFEQWEHRVSPYGGVGYAFVRSDDLTWTGRGGAGGTWEDQGDRGFDPQFLFQTTVDWTIDENQGLTGSVKFAPKMTQFENYLLTVQGNYRVRLGKDTPFSLNLSLLNIYDSQPGPDGTNNDLKLVVSLGYDF